MSNPTLAFVPDVEAAMGRALTPEESERAEVMLVKASELFRLRSGRLFTPGSSTVRLKVNGGEVRLPQSPVNDVQSVIDDCGATIPHTRFGQVLTLHRLSHEFVRVSYTHGSDDVPELIRVTIAEITARVLRIDTRAAAGVTQRSKTTGPFTEAEIFATHAVGGQLLLSPDDLAVALSFRAVSTGGTIVQRA
ncbi:MAG TPA: hypothetical protein VNJ54_07960 [Plantibacter sp.]|uniref:hypothetical protein n=1 Tax=Plantibacter sp. TaxID=1871045 RepID=UPI002BD17F91|nr:hypothetical protein [Plantibacter sp.]